MRKNVFALLGLGCPNTPLTENKISVIYIYVKVFSFQLFRWYDDLSTRVRLTRFIPCLSMLLLLLGLCAWLEPSYRQNLCPMKLCKHAGLFSCQWNGMVALSKNWLVSYKMVPNWHLRLEQMESLHWRTSNPCSRNLVSIFPGLGLKKTIMEHIHRELCQDETNSLNWYVLSIPIPCSSLESQF